MIPMVCAWHRCTASFAGELPEGWIYLATFRTPAVAGLLNFATDRVRRDAALCPAHHQALEYLLKDI